MDKLPSLRTLGEIARTKRKQERLSQKALADLAGVSHVTVLAVEKGTGKARLENAWKILGALGLVEREIPPGAAGAVQPNAPSR